MTNLRKSRRHEKPIFESRCVYMHEKLAAKILEEVGIEKLPKMIWSQERVLLVCPYRKGAAKFFYDMVTRWLIPGKQLDASLSFAMHYQEYLVAEIVLQLENTQDIAWAKHNAPFLEREILMGVNSFYHAKKILELRGLTLDEKTALVQEKIGTMVRRFPDHFDYDIFTEMQNLFLTSKETFKAIRRPSEIGRIVFTLYLFRKSLEKKMAKSPTKRHICIKLRKILLHTPFGLKEVLSIFVGLNFIKEHELFEEKHFLSALSRFIPGARSIPGSYFALEDAEMHRFYLEVEKKSPFSFEEIKDLEKGLPAEIRSRVEQLVPPVFMPRNEEEVMRNILTLSHQLKFLRDLPQMMISFDEQTDTELCFTVVLVRIVHSDSLPIRELLGNGKFSIDRVKIVGMLRRKYPKEATVLRAWLPSSTFLREDFSVDLFQARLQLVKEMESAFGEMRDYNGGMIAKQSENFDALKKELGKVAEKHALLLQNYFHAIFPAHLSTTLDPKLLKILFHMLLKMMETSKETITVQKAEDSLFVMAKFGDISLKQKIIHQIESLGIPSNELLTMQMQVFDTFYLGFLYHNSVGEKQKTFLEVVA